MTPSTTVNNYVLMITNLEYKKSLTSFDALSGEIGIF